MKRYLICAVLVIFFVSNGITQVTKFEEVLRGQKAKAEVYIYEGSGHAFYDYTRPHLHNPSAAKLAYERMKVFLKKQLG